VARDVGDRRRLVQLSRLVAKRLSRPVALSTSAIASDLEAGHTQWTPQLGVGLLVASSHADSSMVLSRVSDMARIARTYPSHVALYDEASGSISEMATDLG
jgi:hypothetical protein